MSSATAAHDSGTGLQNAAMIGGYAFNGPKICPNASGTCLGASGGGGNIGIGNLSALNTRQQFSIAGFFQTTDTTANALFGNYHSNNPVLRLGKDAVAGKLFTFMRDTTGAGGATESTNTDFHNGSTHLFVFSFDNINKVWHLWSDSGRDECSGVTTGLSYWDTGAVMYLQNDFVANLPFPGKAQDWFITDKLLGKLDAQALWFNAGFSGVAPYLPPAPGADPSGGATSPTAFSCSTIADVCAALTELERKIDNAVRFFPVQTPPQLALGTVHAGLTGSGSFALHGLYGVVVDVTSWPALWGHGLETPFRYMPAVASLQLQLGSHFNEWRTINYVHEIYLFPPATWDTLNYAFAPGVTGTITELSRGPA